MVPGSATERKFGKVGERIAHRAKSVIQLGLVAAEFLAERERGSIHKVRATDFYHIHECFGLGLKRIAKLFDARNCDFHEHFIGRDVHGRRKGVVRGLTFVYVIVGVDKLLFVRELAALEHMGAVCDDFIGIHIALSARACLPNDERKLVVQFTCQNLITNLSDEIAFFLG